MGKYCCIMKCNSRSHDWRGKKVDNGGLRFFKFPTWKQSADRRVFEVTKRRRMAWVAAVRRETITFDNIAPHMVVCSRHFHQGKPAYEMDDCHPDWVPSLHLGHNEVKETHAEQINQRRKKASKNTAPAASTDLDHQSSDVAGSVPPVVAEESTHRVLLDEVALGFQDDDVAPEDICGEELECSLCSSRRAEIRYLWEENCKLKAELSKTQMDEHFLKDDIKKTLQADTRSSPSPPLVKVKDEPADDEYEQALTTSTPAVNVKDEPSTTKDDLRIGSVFSVAPTQTLPVIHPLSGHMSCSHCRKNLMKGQTAFQKRGSPALFCSTSCLTTSLPTVKGPSKFCHNCQKLILQVQGIILSPDGKGDMKEFCSQNCLITFNSKKNEATNKPPQPTGIRSLCSMCSRYCMSTHDVILNGAVHKLCSDTCFKRFCTVKNLSMASCANCGTCCHNKPLLLKMEGSSLTVCNAECLFKYKEKTKVTQPCVMCQTARLLADMVDNKNTDDSVSLFCSSSCVMAYKVQTVSASGTLLNCDSCGKTAVPAYHLAMSDTSIRSFCTLPCIMAFQDKFKKSQKHAAVFTKMLVGSTQIQSATPIQPQRDVPKEPQKLSCSQCNCHITFKPEIIQIKDKLVFVCSIDCSQEFKKANDVTSLCEYCKIEKITRDAKRINNKNCFFCSDGCKLVYQDEYSESWGRHCRSCAFCHCMSKKLLTAMYGDSMEEFCSAECIYKYAMLFRHVAKCDTCECKGKLKESLAMLGDVKHFCDLTCLLQFCCDKVANQGETFKGPTDTGRATPVIANVISLAGPPTMRTNASDRPARQSTRNSVKISIQTDTLGTPPPPSPPPRKGLKNKALLCRPLVQNKGVSCKTQTVDCEAQTENSFPQVMVVPVPVPVYVPVPMNMYTQCTPRPVGLPLPLPVPMILPVTMDSAEHNVETIQEIKQKIPSELFEAEVIHIAEMIADENENDTEETPEVKVVENKDERQEAPVPDELSSIVDGKAEPPVPLFCSLPASSTSSSGSSQPSRRSKKRRADDELLQYKQRSEERLLQQNTDICAQLDNMEADWKVLHSLVARMVTVMEDQAKK